MILLIFASLGVVLGLFIKNRSLGPWLVLGGLALGVFVVLGGAIDASIAANPYTVQTLPADSGRTAMSVGSAAAYSGTRQTRLPWWGWATMTALALLSGFLVYVVIRIKLEPYRRPKRRWAPGPDAGYRELDDDDDMPRGREGIREAVLITVFREMQETTRELIRMTASQRQSAGTGLSVPHDGLSDPGLPPVAVDPRRAGAAGEQRVPDWWFR